MSALLGGCAHSQGTIDQVSPVSSDNVQYSVIYYIHGDADYLYHSSNGTSVQADEKALSTAMDIAEKAKLGEVFIFHQLPQKRFLGLFPRKSSRLYYYRNGYKVREDKYSDKDDPFLMKEAHLYNAYTSKTAEKNLPAYFLYYGHEIPNDGGKNYHRTLPNIQVNTESFSNGMQHFLLNSNEKFSLVVLSTCDNGTPAMVKNIQPLTHVLLASPQNLHLSYIDSDSLGLLESDPKTLPLSIAGGMADQTFNRLAERIYTTITLSVYDLDVVGTYVDTLNTLNTTYYEALEYPISFEANVDCVQLPYFDPQRFSPGVKTWYQPARFGRKEMMKTPSGWGCKAL
jgi:hypothetical protein